MDIVTENIKLLQGDCLVRMDELIAQGYVATISSVLFFMWSYARSYALRRLFNKFHY